MPSLGTRLRDLQQRWAPALTPGPPPWASEGAQERGLQAQGLLGADALPEEGRRWAEAAVGIACSKEKAEKGQVLSWAGVMGGCASAPAWVFSLVPGLQEKDWVGNGQGPGRQRALAVKAQGRPSLA